MLRSMRPRGRLAVVEALRKELVDTCVWTRFPKRLCRWRRKRPRLLRLLCDARLTPVHLVKKALNQLTETSRRCW
eukprot:5330073-Amphidinium_carterae.1